MYYSNDENNFRNKVYLEELNKNFMLMFNAYHRFISYRNKLLNELTMSETDKVEFQKVTDKFLRNSYRLLRRIEKDDFKRISK